MNRSMRRYPSPSLVVSITALVISLGGAGYSATGGNFILGQANTASTQTALSANLNGRTLQLSNSNTGASATPLALITAVGHPPFLVNSSTKVPYLNADWLDGRDSTHFPNRLVISYNLAGGADSAPITPPANLPVFVMGVTTTDSTVIGVGQVTLLRFPGVGISWTGLESPSLDPTTITSGGSAAAGTHIVYLDDDHAVDIEVNSVDTIRIHNGSASTQIGRVTLIW
jgi:hypothetical protein